VNNNCKVQGKTAIHTLDIPEMVLKYNNTGTYNAGHLHELSVAACLDIVTSVFDIR